MDWRLTSTNQSPVSARVISSILGVIIIVAILAWGALYVSFDTVRSWPDEADVEGLSGSATITWSDSRVARIQAQSLEDRLSSLGYVHGLMRTWTVVLLRQTSRGRMGEWLGRPADSIDRWVRQLGWARRARRAFEDLPERHREWFRAYARGINAGFEARSHRTPELLLLDLELEPWEPWHALAVEQLVAWLGVTDLSARLAAHENEQMAGRAAAERQLHDWLRLHDFEYSAAWVVENASGRSLVQRQVYGSSALPLIHEVSFGDGSSPRHLATVPGTLMLPAGTNSSYTWSVFPTSSVDLDSVSVEESRVSARQETILRRGGSEYSTEVRRAADGLLLADQIRLTWSGFGAATDIDAWSALWTGQDPQGMFDLLDGAGLLLRRDGRSEILGEPGVIHRFAGGAAVGQQAWLNRLLLAIERRTPQDGIEGFSGNDGSCAICSPWADSLRGRMVSVVGSSKLWRSKMREAMAYVRNWEATYEDASIGASIFDTWLAVYADSTGRLPRMNADWTARERIILYRTFGDAVDRLLARYGEDLSRWRWERIQPTAQYFPLWATPDVLPPNIAAMGTNKYAPVTPSGGGHPSTLRWGPSILQGDSLTASAAWESSVSTSNWHQMYVRKSAVPVDRFLGRYLEAHEYPRVVRLDSSRTDSRRVLLRPR